MGFSQRRTRRLNAAASPRWLAAIQADSCVAPGFSALLARSCGMTSSTLALIPRWTAPSASYDPLDSGRPEKVGTNFGSSPRNPKSMLEFTIAPGRDRDDDDT